MLILSRKEEFSQKCCIFHRKAKKPIATASRAENPTFTLAAPAVTGVIGDFEGLNALVVAAEGLLMLLVTAVVFEPDPEMVYIFVREGTFTGTTVAV